MLGALKDWWLGRRPSRRVDPPDFVEGVLSILDRDGEAWGRDIRTELQAQGWHGTNAEFYRLMGDMEDAGYVEGFHAVRTFGGERKYRRPIDEAAKKLGEDA